MVFVASYAIVVGLVMIVMWALPIAKRQVPEFTTEPIRIGFHFAAEFTTAATLLASGLALLAGTQWAIEIALVAMGMLLYTAIVSPGYFGQKRQWPMVTMFASLVVLALVSVGLLMNESP
jgi:hypothetical protein